MRQAGTLSSRDLAQRLADYLLTQGISSRVEPDGEVWALWVRDEDRLPEAMRELNEFTADPQGAKYLQAGQTADALRKQQARDDQQRRKNYIEVRNRWDLRSAGRRPLTMIMIAICVLVAIVSDGGTQLDSRFMWYLWFSPLPTNAIDFFTWSPLKYIEHGQVWRLVTPIFIHFGPLHLIFNMYMFYLFGTMIESRRGTLRFAALVLAVAALSNFGQYYFPVMLHQNFPRQFSDPGWSSVSFGGMSGVVYGLLGYIWMKSRFDPRSEMFIQPNTVLFLVGWLILCWTGVLDNLVGSVANWAHAVGLVVGMAIGYVPIAWRKLGF
jgi:GlpG protein